MNFTGLTAVKVATAEYWNGVLATNDTIYAIQVGGTGNYDPFPLPSGELAIDVSAGFNTLKAVSSVGHYYYSSAYNATPVWHQVTTDTTSAALNDALRVWSFADGAVIQRADSSLWLADNDTTCLIHAPGTQYIIGKPIKMSASGVKYVKVDIGANGIYGLTSDGNLDLWVRNSQSLTPTRKYSRATAGGMMDVTTCTSDMVVGIIRNASGDTTAGNVYALGASWGDVGGTSVTYSSFTNIMTLLGLTSGTAKRVSMSGEAFHVINTSGQLYGVGKCNSQGEVGNSQEFVNRYTYSTYNGIGWTFDNTEHPVSGPMVLVGGSTVFTDIYDNKFFTFYKFAKDASGNLYSWGRGKTNVLGNGMLLNPFDSSNQFHPNAVDVTAPTLVNPFTAVTKVLHFVTPFGASAGSNQTISSSSTSVTAGGTPITLNLASSPFTKINYFLSSYSWTKTSGGSATIVSPSSQTTSIAGLTTGTYHFQVLETDNNGGQDTAGLTINVTLASPTISVTIGSGAVNITNSH